MAQEGNAGVDDDTDDYMSMSFAEPQESSKVETLTQKRKRLQQEAYERAHPPSKVELARRAEQARLEGLSTALPTTGKGAAMMAKLGYKAGMTLGKAAGAMSLENAQTNDSMSIDSNRTGRTAHRLTVPLGVEIKEDKAGIGALSEKKRKFREEWEKAAEGEKKRVEHVGDFRERVANEREERRVEGMWWASMKILEGLVEKSKSMSVEPEKSASKENMQGKKDMGKDKDNLAPHKTDDEASHNVNSSWKQEDKDKYKSILANPSADQTPHVKSGAESSSEFKPTVEPEPEPEPETESKQQHKFAPQTLYQPLINDRAEKERERQRRANFEQALGGKIRDYGEDDEDEEVQDTTTIRMSRVLQHPAKHDMISEVEVEDHDESIAPTNPASPRSLHPTQSNPMQSNEARASGIPFDESIDQQAPSSDSSEMAQYLALSTKLRLDLVLAELRNRHNYCFWCKFHYPSHTVLEDECPGENEDDHG